MEGEIELYQLDQNDPGSRVEFPVQLKEVPKESKDYIFHSDYGRKRENGAKEDQGLYS